MNDKQCQTSNQKQPKKPSDQTSQSPPNQPTESAPPTTHFLPISSTSHRQIKNLEEPMSQIRWINQVEEIFRSISALLGVYGILDFRENRGWDNLLLYWKPSEKKMQQGPVKNIGHRWRRRKHVAKETELSFLVFSFKGSRLLVRILLEALHCRNRRSCRRQLPLLRFTVRGEGWRRGRTFMFAKTTLPFFNSFQKKGHSWGGQLATWRVRTHESCQLMLILVGPVFNSHPLCGPGWGPTMAIDTRHLTLDSSRCQIIKCP